MRQRYTSARQYESRQRSGFTLFVQRVTGVLGIAQHTTLFNEFLLHAAGGQDGLCLGNRPLCVQFGRSGQHQMG